MKTLRLIGMALVAILLCVKFTACNDAKEDSDNTLNRLYGTWEYTTQRYDWEGKEETSFRRFIFNPDNTFSHIWITWQGWGEMGEDYKEGDDYKGTFRFSEDKKLITITYSYLGSTTSDSYVILNIDDDTLTLIGDDKTITYKRKG